VHHACMAAPGSPALHMGRRSRDGRRAAAATGAETWDAAAAAAAAGAAAAAEASTAAVGAAAEATVAAAAAAAADGACCRIARKRGRDAGPETSERRHPGGGHSPCCYSLCSACRAAHAQKQR